MVKIRVVAGLEAHVDPPNAFIEVTFLTGLRTSQASVGLLNCRVEGLEELGLLFLPIRRGSVPVGPAETERRRGLLSTISKGVVRVARCTWAFYAYLSGPTYTYQSS